MIERRAENAKAAKPAKDVTYRFFARFAIFAVVVCLLRTAADLQRHAARGAVESVATEVASTVAARETVPAPDRDPQLLVQPEPQLRFRLGHREPVTNTDLLQHRRGRRDDAAVGADFRDAYADRVRQCGLAASEETLGVDSEAAAVVPHEPLEDDAAVGHLAIVPVREPVAAAADEEALLAEPPAIASDQP